MTPEVYKISMIVGILLLILGGAAAVFTIRNILNKRLGGKWIKRFYWAAAIGLPLGIGLCCVHVQASPTLRLVGFPFVIFGFQLEELAETDFVNDLWYFLALADFLTGLLLPQVLLTVLAWDTVGDQLQEARRRQGWRKESRFRRLWRRWRRRR